MTMPTDHMRANPELDSLVDGLVRALGPKLATILAYGPAARAETAADHELVNVLVILSDLELPTLAATRAIVDRWVRASQPFPRLVTMATLAEAADVFPIELSEIAERHVVLHGTSPALPAIDTADLRVQCERELREKLMRLQEAYALGHHREAELRRLLVASYPTFGALFRACLRLHGGELPATRAEATAAFCKHAAIDPAPFVEIERVRAGGEIVSTFADLFARYHAAITRAVDAVDRFSSRTASADLQRSNP